MAEARFCRSCGAPVDESDRFCGSCGAAADSPATPPAAAAPPPSAPSAAAASAPTPPAPSGRGRALRTAVLVALGIAVPVLIGLAVYVLIADDGDDSVVAPGSPTETTAPTPTVAASGDPAVDSPAPTTAPGSDDPDPVTTPTTLPPEPARIPVSIDPGDPDSCEIVIGTGGRLASVNGVATGFDIAIGQEIASRVWPQSDVCYVTVPFADRFTAVADRTVRILIRSSPATTSAEEVTDFSTPYLIDGLAVATRSAADPGDLDGLRVAVLAGAANVSDLRNATSPAQFVEIESRSAMYAALADDSVDAVALNWTFLQLQYAQSNDITVHFLDITVEPLVVFVPEGADARRENMDDTIAAMIADGAWAEIFSAEFGTEPWFDPGTMATLAPLDR